MIANGQSGPAVPAAPETVPADGPPMTRWRKVRLVIKVVELRLRFIALMGATGLGFAYWDTIANRYDKWMRPAAGRVATASGIEHYCPMHPGVVQEDPGSCPICGMPLARRKKGEKATLPEGVTSRVALSPSRLAQAGVRTVEVGYSPMAQSLTAVGSVAFDERRLAVISSRVPGRSRVEKLYANYQGMDVMAGEPLAELYNSELAQAVQELLIAQRAGQASPPTSPAARALLGDRRDLVRLSAEKLTRWGITRAQVDAILAQGKAESRIPILSPITGHLLRKNVVEGQEVSEGTAMFEVADLTEVWILAQVYEHQIGLVRPGQAVEATVEAYPGQAFPGKVEFIQPHLDPATRSVEVRFAVANPGHRLRPGMFASVTLKTPVADTPAFLARAATRPDLAGLGRLASLSVEVQKTCPVTGAKLGSMGEPFPVEVGGRKVWTCCSACEPRLKADPAKYLAGLPAVALTPPPGEAKSPTVEDQKVCPVTTAKLGSMGEPIPVEVGGRKVWTCCATCPPKLKAEPARYLARLAPAPRDEVLSVPESAVIDTGSRKVVYVEAEPGVFEGRRVVLGPRVGDRFPVLEGLAPGEKVAAAGAFLIDAESRLNAAEPPAGPADVVPPASTDAPPRSATGPVEGPHRQ